MKRTKIGIQPSLYVLGAVILLFVPIRWIAAVLCSVALHEICHILAVKGFHKDIYEAHLSASGIKLRTELLTNIQELICALAGPASFVIPLILSRWFPRLAVCSAFHTAYNLLPVYPLDGGRVIACLARMCFAPDTAERVCIAMEWFCICGIVFCGFYGTFSLHLGLLPLILAWFMAWRAIFRKIPCKETQLRVQ